MDWRLRPATLYSIHPMKYELLLILAALDFSGPAFALSYRITDLGTMGASASANAINASGQTAGTRTNSNGDSRAWSSTADITPAGATDALAAGINSFGQITGTSYVNGNPYVTVWTNSTSSYIAPGYGTALNDAGQVTGMRLTANGDGHAFVSDGTGLSDLGTLPGGTWSSGYAINGAGTVAGYGDTAGGAFHAFTWSGAGSMVDLGTLGGANSYAAAINGAGTVAGTSQTAWGYLHAFIKTPNGAMTDAGTLGGTSSFGYGINSSSGMVGYSQTAAGVMHAFLYQNGVMIDLNQMLASPAGWTLTAAYALNDSGQIAGTGVLNGVEHAFRLDPLLPQQNLVAQRGFGQPSEVPEPGSVILCATGALLMGLRLFRRSDQSGVE